MKDFDMSVGKIENIPIATGIFIGDLKEAYNLLLQREKKAEVFFKNDKVTQAKKDAWVPEFTKITELLSNLMRKHREITGSNMTDWEVLNGFE